MKNIFWLACLSISLSACDAPKTSTTSTPSVVADNTLTEQEKKEGWQLLFDGKTLNGWRNYGKKTVGKDWRVDDNALHLFVAAKGENGWQSRDGGDIMTFDEFENYEFQLDWKIAPCGNSGIIYNVIETEQYKYVWQTGPEMQVLDNECHPDAKIKKHRAGDLYDLIECSQEVAKPAGQWNKIRLIINKGHLEHWLNGVKVVETQLWDEAWKKMVAGSKFKDMTGFGTGRKGHIALQDHGDKVWFKNIKIKKL
jgi:cytochrome c